MAKKKKGRIAIPFLLTMFISLIIIGGAALFIYNYLGIGKEKELEEPIARNTATAATTTAKITFFPFARIFLSEYLGIFPS